jgi:prepilin-type N-terminal cleavage/methylation domain-containing protein
MKLRKLMNKKGFTIIESVVAMLLVAVIVGGVFTALMASRRAIIEPGNKESMAFAMDSVYERLKTNIRVESGTNDIDNGVGSGPCSVTNPLSTGTGKDVSCLLPDVCAQDATASFKYDISAVTVNDSSSRKGIDPSIPASLTLKRLVVKAKCDVNVL